jgi:amidohydrolase
MSLDDSIQAILPRVCAIRHELHTIPELSYEEIETARVIRRELDRMGVSYVAGVDGAPTATVATIGDASKPCVALRADIDALPITERTGVSYTSKHGGLMHACGHDGHTANLLGTAMLLQTMKLDRCVKLIFQPAEEGGAGANRLVKAGVLDGRVGPRVEKIFGLHGWPGLPVGVVSSRVGPLLASTDGFTIRVRGVGCHGAFPHLGRDPIVCAAELVSSLQHFVSRELDPTEAGLITVGKFHAGTATNVIPDEAVIDGTIRTLTPEARQLAESALKRRAAGIAIAHGCDAIVEYRSGYPSTVNSPAECDSVAKLARELLGADRYLPAARAVMGGEDFAYYAEQVPACFFFVGLVPAGQDVAPPLHSDRFDFNDDALPACLKMFAGLARAG